MKDLAWFEGGSVVTECTDVHGITGQELPLSAGVLNVEQPEWYGVCVYSFKGWGGGSYDVNLQQ